MQNRDLWSFLNIFLLNAHWWWKSILRLVIGLRKTEIMSWNNILWLTDYLLRRLFLIFVPSIAQILLNVKMQIFKSVSLFALWRAHKSQILQCVIQNFILIIEEIDFMAKCTLIFALLNFFGSNMRKLIEASLAAKLLTVFALQHFQLNHHAGWALKVTRKLI